MHIIKLEVVSVENIKHCSLGRVKTYNFHLIKHLKNCWIKIKSMLKSVTLEESTATSQRYAAAPYWCDKSVA